MAQNSAVPRAAQPGFDPYAGHGDTGDLFSDLIRKATAKAVAVGASRGIPANVLSQVTAAGETAVAKHEAADRRGLNAIGGAITKASGKAVNTALPVVQTVLKNVGPIGMVASGAIGAMKAGLSGQNLEKIAWAAAEGAAPSGIDRAITAAHAVRDGGNVVSAAINVAQSQFLPNSPEKLGFNTAVEMLKSTASKAALGQARRVLPTEGAKRAFDSAIGTVSQAVNNGGSVLASQARALTSIAPIVQRVRSELSPFHSNVQSALNMVRNNPTLATRSLAEVARVMGTSQQIANQVMNMAGGRKMLPWRPLSMRAAAFIQRHAKNAPRNALTRDVSGLDSTGTVYIVEAGDNPSLVARKFTGVDGRYVELFSANPTIPTKTTNGVKNFTQFFSGMRLKLPSSWITTPPPATSIPTPPPTIAPSVPMVTTQAPSATPSITPSTTYIVQAGDNPSLVARKFTGIDGRYVELFPVNPNLPTQTTNGVKNFKSFFAGMKLNLPASWVKSNTVTPTSTIPVTPDISASVLQGKSILVAWSKTDGANQGGPSDYGTQAVDLSTTFGPRDSMVDMAFQNWSNRTRATALPTSGSLDAATLTELQKWAEQKAASVSPSVPGMPTATVPGTPSVIPGLPAGVPSDAIPGMPQASTPTPSVSPTTPPSTSPTASNSATPTVTPAGEKKTSIVPMVVGGIGGALLFGPVGAVAGAGIGAAVA